MSKDPHSLSIKARKKVKAEMEKAERERTLNLFQKRMELARVGAVSFKAGKLKESATAYYQYLDILERTKGVKQGGLAPAQFDLKKDIAEMLLVSGVFWDLAKLHDKISKKDTAKLDNYLRLFILFSKNMPYQYVSAELLRKYMVNGLPIHKANFKDAHLQLGGGRCFIATAVQPLCADETLPSLRDFRDQVLMENVLGRCFVKIYYQVGPLAAAVILRTPIYFRKQIAKFLDRFAQTWNR